ncbi:hypothetical protein [Kineococcus terrestris]|uniref:hypothetical protein n=1 Tax=Kineococcus terrestris TaxID=2044856 RepID=UPI0034DB4783
MQVAVTVDTGADPAPVVQVRLDGRSGTASAAASAHVAGGGAFRIAVDLIDPRMAAWDPDAQPAVQRKLWRERTIWRPSLLVQPRRIEADGLLVLALDGSGRTGYAGQPGDPEPELDAAGGSVGAVEGWHVLLLKPAAASFTLSAPARWGPTGQITGPADGIVSAAVTVRPATGTTRS